MLIGCKLEFGCNRCNQDTQIRTHVTAVEELGRERDTVILDEFSVVSFSKRIRAN